MKFCLITSQNIKIIKNIYTLNIYVFWIKYAFSFWYLDFIPGLICVIKTSYSFNVTFGFPPSNSRLIINGGLDIICTSGVLQNLL